jgi:hypothetical protein
VAASPHISASGAAEPRRRDGREAPLILAPGGLLALAVPDKWYCFDCERENSSLGRVIDVAHTQSTNHSAGTATEYFF